MKGSHSIGPCRAMVIFPWSLSSGLIIWHLHTEPYLTLATPGGRPASFALQFSVSFFRRFGFWCSSMSDRDSCSAHVLQACSLLGVRGAITELVPVTAARLR